VQAINLQRTYGVGASEVFGLVTSGEFLVACGALRTSVEIDPRPGGKFVSSVLSGVIDDVAPDALELTLTDGSHVTLTINDVDGAGELAVVHDRPDSAALWTAGLTALAPEPGRFDADATERQTYDNYLHFYRSAIPGKLHGLSEADARRRLVGSATTLLGLAKHLIGVERNWFQVVMSQRSRADVGPNNSGGEDSWQLGPDETVSSVLAMYDAVCAESMRIAVRYELDETVPHERIGAISVRMILVHLIEEIARHAGHADILRELLDGSTGFAA
jgi:hypothetical protein